MSPRRSRPRHHAIVRLLLPASRREEVLGDLAERRARSATGDSRRATLRYGWALAICIVRLQAERLLALPSGLRINGLGRELRYAARGLRRAPAFSGLVVAILALGVGATTTVFSLVQSILLDSLGFERAERLVHIHETTPRGSASIAYPNFTDWRRRQTGLEAMAAYNRRVMNLTGSGEAVRLAVVRANADLFRVLRVAPHLGRPFNRLDDRVGADRTVILAFRTWQDRFAADPEIVGRKLLLDEHPYTVIAVMPPGFQFPEFTAVHSVDAWVPLELFADEWNMWHRSDHPGLYAVGRLRDAIEIDQAQAGLDAIAAALEDEYPETNAAAGVELVPLLERVVGDSRPALRALLAAVGFMLLIACSNCANLLLVRAGGRADEMALRAALGAPRSRLVRQLVVESLVLALAAGAVGLWLARVSLPAVARLAADALPRLQAVAVDGRAALFALAASVATGLMFGLAPAGSVLRGAYDTGVTSARVTDGARRARVRNGLVVAEIALALTLLIGAGLAFRSVARLMSDDAGLQTAGVLTAQLQLPELGYPDVDSVVEFWRDLSPRLEALPGVEAVGTVNPLPLSGDGWGRWYYVEGTAPADPADIPVADYAHVTHDALAALGVPIVRGRGFVPGDRRDAPRVAIVDQGFADRWWGDAEPIGKRIKLGTADTDSPWVEVVGVAAPVRKRGVAGSYREQIWVPYEQDIGRYLALVLRTPEDPSTLARLLREQVRAVDPQLPLYDVRTLDDYLVATADRERMLASLIGGFALMGVLLAALGLYGVLSYAVSTRRREIGIRMALGASRSATLRLVAGQGTRLVSAGIGIGLILAYAVARVLANELYGVSATDPRPFLAVAFVMAIVASAACILPSWRAACVDPIQALRAD